MNIIQKVQKIQETEAVQTIHSIQTKRIFGFSKVSKGIINALSSFLLFCLFPLTILLAACSTTMPNQSAIDPLRENPRIIFKDLTKTTVIENKEIKNHNNVS